MMPPSMPPLVSIGKRRTRNSTRRSTRAPEGALEGKGGQFVAKGEAVGRRYGARGGRKRSR
jgi:hypothetical protein